MSLKMTTAAMALAIAGSMSAAPAWSQTASSTMTNPEVKLAAQYATLAGSQRNAESLITGLRDGKNVLLLTGPGSTNPTAASAVFTPATGKLGYGNINTALSLAKADLASIGITNPTPAQLAAALNGGAITTASGTYTMAGVLAQRQAGMGWGQIAAAQGTKLGAVVSASKTDKAGKKDAPAVKTETSSESVAHGKSDQAHAGDAGNKGGNSGGAGSNSGSGNSSSGGKSGGSGGGGGGGGGSSGGGGGRGR